MVMSVERDQLRDGVCVRLLSHWSSVPQGTTGKIGTVICNEGLRSAIFCFRCANFVLE